MKALLYRDTFPRLVADMKGQPWKWLSRLVFLLGPWAAFWMVEILNQNDVFSDLQAWQVLMNLVWYYILFLVCRLVLGRRRAAALAICLSFLIGLVNHYVLRFRGRILFPADVASWKTAANVADAFDFSIDVYMEQAAVLLVAYLFLVWMCQPQPKRDRLPLPVGIVAWVFCIGYSFAVQENISFNSLWNRPVRSGFPGVLAHGIVFHWGALVDAVFHAFQIVFKPLEIEII